MKLSCADYTWPTVSHWLALQLISQLGFGAVDLGFMYGRSHIHPEAVAADTDLWAGRIAERCSSVGLDVADLFAQAPDFETMAVNNPDPEQRRAGREFFALAVRFATRLGSPGITILPGVEFPGDTRQDALARSVRTLRDYTSMAAEAGLRLSVEPHIGSIVDTPGRAAALVDAVPGLRLTLDYGHFTAAGFADTDVEALLPFAAHVQCRGAAKGKLQADMRNNIIDFGRVIAGLRATGYAGYVACEYVWSEWQGCNRVDNLTETTALRDVLLEQLTAGCRSVGGRLTMASRAAGGPAVGPALGGIGSEHSSP